jgi:hypothetical protein
MGERTVNAKVYTVAEARAALPKVRTLMAQAMAARDEIIALRPEVWPVLRKAAGNGGNVQTTDLFRQFQRLEAGVKGITGMGIVVKDMDHGLVDFLADYKGRRVYLCWKYDESELRYWHDLNAGFAGRQVIDE